MKYKLSILLFSLLFFSVSLTHVLSQVNENGNPLMVSYDYAQTGGSEWNYSMIQDDRGIIYFGNEIQGVIEFDGTNWNSIRINDNPVIYALEKDQNGVIYASGPYEFGYIEPGDNGNLEYVSLSARLDSASKATLGDVYDIQYFEGNIYFVSKKTIYRYNHQTDLLDTLNTDAKYYIMTRAYSVNDHLIIADNREGLIAMSGDSIRALPGGDTFGMDYCFAVLPYDSAWCLVGTFFNGLHMYNHITGEVRTDFASPEIYEEIKANQIYNGCVLSDGKFAFGTTKAGVYIFDRKGELVERYSNKSSGLHDDQIYFTSHDGTPSFSSQLWMSVVEKIYRISYNLPIRYFDERNNITFPIRGICEFNGDVFVGGDKGVARMSSDGDKIILNEIEGFSNQTFLIVPFYSDNKSYLLAGTLDGLFIIDESGNFDRFVDIQINPSDRINANSVFSVNESEFHDGIFFLGLNGRMRIIEYRGGKWKYNSTIPDFAGNVQYLVEESPSRIWVSTIDMDKLYTVDISDSDTTVTEYVGSEIEGMEIKTIKKIDNSIILVTGSSILRYNNELGKFEEETKYLLEDDESIIYEDFVSLGDYGVLISAYDYRNFDYLVRPDGSKVIDIFFLLPKSHTSRLMLKENMLWLPKMQEIFLLDLDRIGDYEYHNDVLIRKVTIGGDSVLFNGVFYEETDGRLKRLLKHQPKSKIPKINHSLNDITFHWSSNNLISGDSTSYSFMIEGFDEEWSGWENVKYKDYTNLQHGKYIFKIRAKGLTRHVTEETVYEFEIRRAWYQSVIAMIIYTILIIVTIITIIKVYTRRLINENLRLEGIVADRTREVVKQKEELEASIHYASRIQRAILPSEKALIDKVKEYFILFRPRDIVSGDFYWVSERGSRLYIVAADCTGHGVPGAFMSILGISFLDEIVNKAENTETDDILNSLRKHVTDSLKQMGEGIEEAKDGMDLGILVINYANNEIEYSGAYNPCWVVRKLNSEEKKKFIDDTLVLDRSSLTNGEYILESIDADRMPIGISSRMDQPFKMHKQKLEKGVSYYLLSDGYSDQFGGESGRKFLKKNLKKLILEVQGLPMKQQRDLLENRLLDWMGDHDQVDDILIMGVSVL